MKLLEALRQYNLEEPKRNVDDGRMHRWGHNNRCWGRRFEGGYVFGDFSSGLNTQVFDRNECEYSKAELRTMRASMEKARKESETEQAKIHEEGAAKAVAIWESAQPVVSSQGYIARKHVSSHGLREHDGRILIPLRDEFGKLWSLQFIEADGTKKFMCGGKKKGCYFAIGDIEKTEQIFICEGYATGATIHECTGIPVVVAFDASGLKPISQKIKEKYPNAKIVICADNDRYHSDGTNPGVEKANEAAELIGAYVVKPEFKDLSKKPTDFNDLFVLEGAEAVKTALQNAAIPNIPAGFFLTNDGLFFVSEKSKERKRISNYIKVLAFTKNNKKISKLVEFKDYKNRLLKTTLHSAMFSKGGDQVRIHLSDLGFVYSWNQLAKSKLVEYLSDSIPEKEAIVATHTGFLGDVYVRPDLIIGDTNEEIILDESIDDSAFSTNGSLADWQNHLAKYCGNNSRLMFSVSTAFASVLLRICEIPNVGFHIIGNSSSGKTTCLNVAASVFGDANYVVSWKTTDNALENTAFKRNDALLILDELSEMPSSKAGDVAYMLANGKGKGRMDKNCKSREILRWKLVFLSSGEIDLTAHMAEANKTSKAGQKVRLLNISAKASENSHGIFEDLHGFKDGAEFSNYLMETAAQYYGVASIEFIKQVVVNMKTIKPQYKREFSQMKTEHLPEQSEGQDLRAFERFVFVGFAGELAIKYGVVNWKTGDSYAAALKCFNAWLDEKEGVGDDEDKQILCHVKAFFELHAHSRFYDLDGFKDQRIINMAGYKSVYKDAVIFYVSPSVFQDEICKGFTRKAVIDLLIKNKFLQQNSNGDYRQQKWTPYGNKKVYVISGRILL
jgi:putative DNA primase/helicase